MTAEFVVAVHALVYLNHKQDFVQSEEIALNVCTNPARIRKVMTKLKKASLVISHSSFNGGYKINKDSSDITLYDIFKATSNHFIKVTWRSGNECAKCDISKNMEPIMDEVFNSLEESCKNTLLKTTIEDIDKKIFNN